MDIKQALETFDELCHDMGGAECYADWIEEFVKQTPAAQTAFIAFVEQKQKAVEAD